jgi:hypothetical protein
MRMGKDRLDAIFFFFAFVAGNVRDIGYFAVLCHIQTCLVDTQNLSNRHAALPVPGASTRAETLLRLF